LNATKEKSLNDEEAGQGVVAEGGTDEAERRDWLG
jgi:hypothetical protein